MAREVVDHLEVVEIEQQQGQRLIETIRAAPLLSQALIEMPAVVEAREIIAVGELTKN